MPVIDICAHCGGNEIYHREGVHANCSEIRLLPGVYTGFLGCVPGKFDVFVCAKCGHTQFFVEREFLDVVREKWTRVDPRLTRHE